MPSLFALGAVNPPRREASEVLKEPGAESDCELKQMGEVLLFHPGTGPFVQQASRALHEAGLLSAYVTTFCYWPTTPTGRAIRAGLSIADSSADRNLRRRMITEVPSDLVKSHALPELIRMSVSKLGLGPIASDLTWEQTEKWFDRIVARRHLKESAAVYGYEHAALETFKAQSARNRACIYEMPICHHQTTAELLLPEFERFPGTQTKRDRHIQRHAIRRNRRKDAELALADLVMVNSVFTKNSLVRVGIAESKIVVIPLGAPEPKPVGSLAKKNPIIFLSAGTQSVRKGAHYLLEAWRRLKPGPGVELWLVGQSQLPANCLAGLPGKVVIRPSVPRPELFEIYSRASVLVFPTLAEGFGMVITEAMSQGLPVITTENTGGPAFIRNGENGFIIPIRDAAALAEKMQWCLDNSDLLPDMGEQALAAAFRWQWSHYRAALGSAVSSFLSNGH